MADIRTFVIVSCVLIFIALIILVILIVNGEKHPAKPPKFEEKPPVKPNAAPRREHIDPVVFASMVAAAPPKRRAQSGRCSGDCAHCPPHYGYRYGRWYYGHDHSHGCEFGGNRGGGGMR